LEQTPEFKQGLESQGSAEGNQKRKYENRKSSKQQNKHFTFARLKREKEQPRLIFPQHQN
jgi:hypothetical protein